MFNDPTLALSFFSDPASIQNTILKDLETRSADAVIVSDPNNAFNVLLEGNASSIANCARVIDTTVNGLYKRRCDTVEELHRHMSGFDYVFETYGPAQTTVRLMLDKDDLISRAEVFNDDYRKVVIPATSVFSIGPRQYGLYYPIEIRINRTTDNVTVAYDTSIQNPLKTLETNVVENVTFKQNGINWLVLTFPIYQFTRQDIDEVIPSLQGFHKKYSYTGNFYAARVWTLINSVWTELDYTLSDDTYDRMKPTARIQILSDLKKVDVSIPYIYFTNRQIGNRLKISLFSTEGEIDIAITQAEATAANVNFDVENSTRFTTILGQLPTIKLVPTETRVVGGSNGLPFLTLRDRVINNSLYSKVPVSPTEVTQHFNKAGFEVSKQLDTITDRVYIANRKLTGGFNNQVSVTSGAIEIKRSKLSSYSTIKAYADNTVTILPTTIYRYVSLAKTCIPLDDTERTRLGSMTKQALADEMNAVTYTRTPYHIVLYGNDRYPLSKSFNLDPTIKSLKYIQENAKSTIQMSVVNADVIHLTNNTGGYTLRLAIQKTADMASIPESAIYVVLVVQDKSGRSVYFKATRTFDTDTVQVYSVTLPTDYHITIDRYFRSIAYVEKDEVVTCDIPLEATFDIRLLVSRDYAADVIDDTTLKVALPEEFSSHVALAKQSLTVTFGEDMSDGIYNATSAIWGPQTYVKWLETVYLTYPNDVYKTDENGLIILKVVKGVPTPILLHKAGDFILDTNGQKIPQYVEGDFKRDTNGLPIVNSERELTYYIDSIQFDGRLYASEHPTDVKYANDLRAALKSYVDTVVELGRDLSEQTKTYFLPTRTMGTATFSVGDGTTVQYDLGLSFKIKYYVTEAIRKDEARLALITKVTEDTITEEVAKQVISTTEMTRVLKNALGDMIVSIDTLGINGVNNLQTLISAEDNDTTAVALKLVVNADGTLSLKKDIEIQWSTVGGA